MKVYVRAAATGGTITNMNYIDGNLLANKDLTFIMTEATGATGSSANLLIRWQPRFASSSGSWPSRPPRCPFRRPWWNASIHRGSIPRSSRT